MRVYIKNHRELAGLTQAQLAEKMDVSVPTVQNWESGRTNVDQKHYIRLSEILNVPVEQLIKEMLIEMDNESKNLDNWPYFLFDDETNEVIDELHLNRAQQELVGLLYIYDSKYLKKDTVDYYTLEKDLKKIPFGFIDKVGSIRFMNQIDGLHKVIKHVKADFLLNILKLNPDAEFNIKRLSKDQICEFIDNGHKVYESVQDEDADNFEGYDALRFYINMRKAKIMLPILRENGPVHLTDGWWANPLRDDIPKKVLDGIIEKNNYNRELFNEGYYKNFNISCIIGGFEFVTDFYEDKDKKWMWKINEKGEELLEWFQSDKNDKE